MRVVRSQGLREDVTDANRFHNRSHSPSGDDTRTFRGWLEENTTGAELTQHLVGDRSTRQNDSNEALLGPFDSLPDCLWDLVGLSHSNPHTAIAVATHYSGTKAEP